MPRRSPSTQRTRTAVLAANLLVLCGVNWIVTGSPLAEAGGAGLWFYSAAFAFLLADLVVEPWYTKPADALVNASAVLIAALSTSAADFSVPDSTFAVAKKVVIGAALVIVFLAVLAIATKPQNGEPASRLHRSAFAIAGTVGSARIVFGALFAVAAAGTFVSNVEKLLALYVFALFVLEERVIERLLTRVLDRPKGLPVATAVVERVVEPRTVTALASAGSDVQIGASALRDGATIGVVTYVTSGSERPVVEVALQDDTRAGAGQLLTFEGGESRDAGVVGSVTAGTQLDRIKVRVAPSRADRLGVADGSLLTAEIRGKMVLYQVVAAEVERGGPEAPAESTKLTIVARKLGRWDEGQERLVPVDWVPQPGSPVLRASVPTNREFDERFVGMIPESRYGVEFDPDGGITHNTAVFGILGSGKTTLASELIWRTIEKGAKVVVLDITNQWARLFGELDAQRVQEDVEERLANAIEAREKELGIDREAAGNIDVFRQAVQDELQEFLNGPTPILICNPARLRVTRELGFLKGGQAQAVRGLTPAEVTACFAEALLELVSDRERDKVYAALVLEEAHTLAPEFNAVVHDREKQATAATARALLQGRKYGLGCVVVTQRTANVTKTILNQCNTVFALRNYDQTGAEFLSHFIGMDYASLLANLRDRRAVVFGRGSSSRSPVIVDVNDAECAGMRALRARIAKEVQRRMRAEQREESGNTAGPSRDRSGGAHRDGKAESHVG